MRWRRRNRAEDLERELRAHLELEAEEQQETGLPANEAGYAALRAFGNTTLIKEDVRAMWNWTLLERAGQDLRYAARTMRKNRGFSAVASCPWPLASAPTRPSSASSTHYFSNRFR